VLPSLLFSTSAIIIAFYYCLVQLSWVLMDWNGIAAINNFRYSRSCITTLYYILSYRAAQQIKNKYLMPTHGTEKSHPSQFTHEINHPEIDLIKDTRYPRHQCLSQCIERCGFVVSKPSQLIHQVSFDCICTYCTVIHAYMR